MQPDSPSSGTFTNGTTHLSDLSLAQKKCKYLTIQPPPLSFFHIAGEQRASGDHQSVIGQVGQGRQLPSEESEVTRS